MAQLSRHQVTSYRSIMRKHSEEFILAKKKVKLYLETLHAFLQLYILPWSTRENFSDMERLAQETLNLSCTSDCQLVILTELVHTQDSNNILKIFVVLKNLLNTTSSVVVLLTQNMGGQHSGCGVERINGRVNTKLRNLQRDNANIILIIATASIRRNSN